MHQDTFRIDAREDMSTDILRSTTTRVPDLRILLPILLLLLSLFGPRSAAAQEEELDQTLGIGPLENLGAGPNTEWAELLPRSNADGTRLYFIRKHAPTNLGGVGDQDDIYYSELRADGTWGEGVNIGPPLNTPGSDALFWISPDEKTALVYHGRMIDGREQGLSIARKVNGRWSEPQAVSIDGVESLGNWYYATISPDREHLLLAYRVQGDEYNLDIFYAPALSGDLMRWGKPEPINGLNTSFIEASPWLSGDGRSLYFVSDRVGGAGLGDIYVTRRVADDWRYWSKPELTGSSVNTPVFEADVSISPDGRWLYTARVDMEEPPSRGRSDLYRSRLPDTLGSTTTIIVTGQLVDAATGAGLRGEAQILIQRRNMDLGIVETDREGRFSMRVMPGLMLKVIGIAPGYETGGVIFDGRRIDPTDPPRFVQVQLRRSARAPAQDIRVLFATGSARLDGAARGELQRFAEAWKNAGGHRNVTLYGYTDSVGDAEKNLDLAENRAKSVAEELRRLGVPAGFIRVVPRGEAPSAGDRDDLGSDRLNRRVDVSVE